MAKIGFVGTGEIAVSCIQGLLEQGHQIHVSERGRKHSEKLVKLDEVEVADNQTVLDKSDMVFLCLMAETAKAILPELTFRKDHQIVSVMADVELADLQTLCAPANYFELTIPLASIAIGGCPLPCFPDDLVSQQLFGAANPVFTTDSEAALRAHMAVTALASVSFAQTKAASKWLAGVTDDPKSAEVYLLSMMSGFFAALPKDGDERLEQALAGLNTEGGFNATLRQHMEDTGSYAALRQGLDAFRERLKLPAE